MNVGLDDWIAKSHEEYVSKAIRFAQDVDALAHLRIGLRQKLINSPLCDAPRFAAQFEEALRGMWRLHCESVTAKPTS